MSNKKVSLKQFAELNDISYKTAHRHWKQGNIEGIQLPTGTILVSGWKRKPKYEETEAAKKCVILIRAKNIDYASEVLLGLKQIAKDNKVTIIETIIWDGFIFQENPYIEHIILTNAQYVLTDNAADIYGINHQTISLMLRKMGIETIQSKGENVNITNMIYSSISAASSMARSAVGMSSYKRAIAQANNNLLS